LYRPKLTCFSTTEASRKEYSSYAATQTPQRKQNQANQQRNKVIAEQSKRKSNDEKLRIKH
jgi:hypothetical protein